MIPEDSQQEHVDQLVEIRVQIQEIRKLKHDRLQIKFEIANQ